MSATQDKQTGYRVKGKRADWVLEGDLSIGVAADIHTIAMKLVSDARVQHVSLTLPTNGLPLATYQIITALKRELEAAAKSCEITGSLVPYGGRAW